MIIEYNSKYDEEIKELLVQLQQYLADMDIEGYNIVGDEYKEKYFEKTLEEIKKCNGKILLYKDNEKIINNRKNLIENLLFFLALSLILFILSPKNNILSLYV